MVHFTLGILLVLLFIRFALLSVFVKEKPTHANAAGLIGVIELTIRIKFLIRFQAGPLVNFVVIITLAFQTTKLHIAHFILVAVLYGS